MITVIHERQPDAFCRIVNKYIENGCKTLEVGHINGEGLFNNYFWAIVEIPNDRYNLQEFWNKLNGKDGEA